MFREGQRVSYVGENLDYEIGSVGRVLTTSGTDCNVMWETGPRTGKVDLIDDGDLAAPNARVASEVEFESPLAEVPVFEVYASHGARGLYSRLSKEGHLSNTPDIAERVMEFAATLVRSDVTVREVIASLGEDADDFVLHVAGRVLAQAGRECGA